MTHDPREVPQITMADIRKHTGEGMVSEQNVIDAANELLKEIYTSLPPAAGWNEAIEAAKLVVERWSLPTIQAPSMWLIDKAGIVAEIESLRREAPASSGVNDDEVIGDAETLRGFINTYKMTPSMMASEMEIWKGRALAAAPSRHDAGGGVRLPQGYALVPTKPTPAMIEAGCEQNPTQWNEGTDLGFAADVANDVYVAMVSAAALSTPPAAVEKEADDWRDDPSADERWNAGLDFAMGQFCVALGVDPKSVRWDAATETLDGDVNSVIWNILRARFGEDWDPAAVESNGSVEIEDARAEAADSLRTLDAIAEYVGCPHDEELTVEHVRQHYMKLENAAQRQGIEDAGRIANAQAYASAEARLREAVIASISMIENCAGVPTNSDSLPQMVKVHLQQALSAAGDEAKKSEGGVPAGYERVTDGTTLPGDKFRYRLDDNKVTGEVIGHFRPINSSDPTAERREIVARIINPEVFAKYDAELAKDRRAENGKRWADVCYGEALCRALAKADAILAALDGGS